MNGQQIPLDYMADPAALDRLYPTRRDNDAAAGRHGTVPLGESVEEFTGGDDDPNRGIAYATGQRQHARVNESRSALTTRDADDDAITAPPGWGPGSPAFEHAPFSQPPVRRARRLSWGG